jgi:hypothetical protein
VTSAEEAIESLGGLFWCFREKMAGVEDTGLTRLNRVSCEVSHYFAISPTTTSSSTNRTRENHAMYDFLEEEYLAVQRIYYPGFTIAGVSEPLALISAIVILFLTSGTVPFWTTLLAVVSLLAMQAVYWILIHPVNKAWLEGEKLSSAASEFFRFGKAGSADKAAVHWTDLRHRWEFAHVARAGLAFTSFVALVIATS